MAVSYVGKGAINGSQGAVTIAVPAGRASGDLLLLYVATANQTPATPSGWTFIRSNGVGTAGDASLAARITIFAKITGASEPSVTVADSGAETVGQMLAYRGTASTVAAAIDTSSDVGGATASDASPVDCGSITPSSSNQMLVFAVALSQNKTSGALVWSTLRSYTGFTDDGASGFTAAGVSATLTFAHGKWSSGTVASPSASVTFTGIAVGSAYGVIGLKEPPPTNNVTTAGTFGHLTGAASVQLKDNLTIAGALGPLSGAAQVDLVMEATVAGTLGPLSGAAQMDFVAIDHTIAGAFGPLSGAAQVDLVMEATVAGTLGPLSGASQIDFVAIDHTIAGALGPLSGAAQVDLVMEATVAGTLGPLSGASQIDFVAIDHTIAGALGPLSGAAQVDLVMEATVAGTLGPLSGAAQVDLVMEATIAGALGPLSGAAQIQLAVAATTEPEQCYDVNDDRRELILSRLASVLGGLSATFARNDMTIPVSTLPMVTMLDGDETAMERTFGRGRPASGPNIISIVPEVYVTVATPSLSDWEESIKTAVLADATLIGMCHDIRYIGNESDFMSGTYGQMKLEFAFDYVLRVVAPCVPPVVSTDTDVGNREQILQALASIAVQTEGVVSVVRNDASVPDDSTLLPRVLIFDAGEETDIVERSHPPSSPGAYRMEPEVYIMLREGDGPMLNQIRYMLLRGILTDTTLAGLALDGDIRYEGSQTALAAGRSLTGEMGLVVSIGRVG